MPLTNFAPGEAQTNPDVLQAIILASEQFSIVASQDIVDIRGLKLWAKGRHVSAALQQRLLERKLLHPLEACLTAEDGVTPFTLLEQFTALMNQDNSLARALQPSAALLEEHLKQIPLHAVAQLLLTTAFATRPETLPHAVAGMALAGAIAHAQSTPVDMRLAMLGGLLHDIGEAYIQPTYLDRSTPLDLLGYKHMMAHPRMAQMLLTATTDYPATLCRAVGEHHERLNGAGYPARLSGDDISPLGLILAAVEVTLGIARTSEAPLTRASFALRVVPGEFPERYGSTVFNMAREANEPLPTTDDHPQAVLEHINTTLRQAEFSAQTLQDTGCNDQESAIINLALERLGRLRVAWNALGVWGVEPDQLTENDRFEMSLAGKELYLRQAELQRECMLLAERLPPHDTQRLQPIWAGLLN